MSFIETEETTDPDVLKPLQGNPGHQEHQVCYDCSGLMHVEEVIWESAHNKRVVVSCEGCDYRGTTEKGVRMFRYQFTVRGP